MKNTYQISIELFKNVEASSEREALQKMENLLKYLEETQGLNLEGITDVRCVACYDDE